MKLAELAVKLLLSMDKVVVELPEEDIDLRAKMRDGDLEGLSDREIVSSYFKTENDKRVLCLTVKGA